MSTLPQGEVMRIRGEQFDRVIEIDKIKEKLESGKTLKEIFPQIDTRNLRNELANHDPFDYS